MLSRAKNRYRNMLNGSESNWVESITGLQKNIDEHERFLGDVLLLAISRDLNRQFIGGHRGSNFFEPTWNAVASLIKENIEMSQKIAEYEKQSREKDGEVRDGEQDMRTAEDNR